MKIKLIAITLLGTALVCSPVFAHIDATDYNSSRSNKSEDSGIDHSGDATNDEVDSKEAGSGMATGKRTFEPLVIKKGIDKASPLGVDKIGDIEGESTKASDFGTRVSTEGQAHRATVAGGGGDSEELQSSKGYIKIGDIKGNSTKASSAIPPSISGVEVTAPSQSAISDESNDDDDDKKCDNLKENESCVDGHVTVLK